jgi:hypothetical protein
MPSMYARAIRRVWLFPMHRGELKRKTLRGIIQDLRISVEEFADLL